MAATPPVRLSPDGESALRTTRITVADFAAAGLITAAKVHACWLDLFPAGTRTVARREGEAFAQALGERLSLSTEAVSEIRDLCCPQLGTFRLVDLLLKLRAHVPKGYAMPVPLTTPEEARPYLCSLLNESRVPEFLQSAHAESDSYLALLPKDVVRLVELFRDLDPKTSLRVHTSRSTENGPADRRPGDFIVGTSAAFLGPDSNNGPRKSARAVSLSDGKTLWVSEALSENALRTCNHLCVTTEGAVMCILGNRVWIFKVPFFLPGDCCQVIPSDRNNAYAVCLNRDFTLVRIDAHAQEDGWTRHRPTELVQWKTAEGLSSLSLTLVRSTQCGVVCAVLGHERIQVHYEATETTLGFGRSTESEAGIALSDSLLCVLDGITVRTYALPKYCAPLATFELTGVPKFVSHRPWLCALPDGCIVVSLGSDHGLHITQLDPTGRSIVHSRLAEGAVPTRGAAPFALYGRGHIVRRIELRMQPTLSNRLMFEPIRADAERTFCTYSGPYMESLFVRGDAIVGCDDTGVVVIGL